MICYGQMPDGRRHDNVQRLATEPGGASSTPRAAGRKPGPPGKAVVVDGKVYPSINEAAEMEGCNRQRLADALRAGKAEFRGMSVRFAEEGDLHG